MAYIIKFSSIPVFQFLTPDYASKLMALFHSVSVKPNTQILTYGQPVTGVYIVGEGFVDVYTENFKSLLARIEKGHIFGEMSLLDQANASANIKSPNETVTLFFCSHSDFMNFLNTDSVFASLFYKGAALVISNRLRSTNEKIEKELSKGQGYLRETMESANLLRKISITKNSIELTELSVMTKLSDLIPIINSLKDDIPTQKGKLSAILKVMENIVNNDTQNLERIGAQVTHIQEHLFNMERLINGQNCLPVPEANSLFTNI